MAVEEYVFNVSVAFCLSVLYYFQFNGLTTHNGDVLNYAGDHQQCSFAVSSYNHYMDAHALCGRSADAFLAASF